MAYGYALFSYGNRAAGENMNKNYNVEYSRHYTIAEKPTKLEDELVPYLSEKELSYVLGKKNRATQLISLQSAQLKQLSEDGWLDNFRHMELENILKELYDQQGKCERIKISRTHASLPVSTSFLYACLCSWFRWVCCRNFPSWGKNCVWFTIPFSVLVSWVFNAMEKVGEHRKPV